MNNALFFVIFNLVFVLSFLAFVNIIFSVVVSTLSVFILVKFLPKNVLSKLKLPLERLAFIKDEKNLVPTLVSLVIFIIIESQINFEIALILSMIIFCYMRKVSYMFCYHMAFFLVILAGLSAALGLEAVTKFVGYLIYYFLGVGIVWQIFEMGWSYNRSKLLS